MATPALIPASDLSEEEFERRTLDAIHREFGPGGVVRFLMAFRSGKGDYTAERREWVDKLSLEDLIRNLEATGSIHQG